MLHMNGIVATENFNPVSIGVCDEGKPLHLTYKGQEH